MNAKEKHVTSLIAKFVGSDVSPIGTCQYVDQCLNTCTTYASFDLLPPQKAQSVRIVVISDTHERHDLLNLPPGDVLLHCGDVFMFNAAFTPELSLRKLRQFNQWMTVQPYKEKILISGNHDKIFETLGKNKVNEILTSCQYIENEFITLQCGLSIFGSPASTMNSEESPNRAFQYDNQITHNIFAKARMMWFQKKNRMKKLDIVMAHGPLHTLPTSAQDLLVSTSCSTMFCGHIHEEHGSSVFAHSNGLKTSVINASTMGNVNKRFQPCNPPIVIDIVPSLVDVPSSRL